MRVLISDPASLATIPPHSLIAYAKAQGWQPTEAFGETSVVYEKEGAPELILPKSSDIGDYEDIVFQVIETLSRAEERGQLQIFSDLVSADKDNIRLSAKSGSADGVIGLDTGLGFLQSSYLLLQSAACSAVEPKVYYHAGRNRRATSYMQKVQLGQTERGSFVVNFLAPVPPALYPDQSAIWPDRPPEPFERLVTFRFVQALHAAKEAAAGAVQSNLLESFYRLVPKGISANLCLALADLISFAGELDIGLTWARTRPLEEGRHKIKFRSADEEIYREAARAFLEIEPRYDETFTAYVVRFKREATEERGHIGLQLFGQSQPLAATADVSDELYHTAILAHEQKSLVQVTGDLQRKGQRWHFEPLHDLVIVRDLFDDWEGNSS